MSDNGSELTASRKRAAHPDFVPTFSVPAVRDRLPLRLPVPDGTPPSPKRPIVLSIAIWATMTCSSPNA
jgi:hypothetical protein